MPHRHEHLWAHGHPCGHGYGIGPGPEMLLSGLNTVLWIALCAVLAWALLKWISLYILPTLADMFDMAPEESPALEILRQRYAAGEIDTVTFEQMRERLEASYQQRERAHPS